MYEQTDMAMQSEMIENVQSAISLSGDSGHVICNSPIQFNGVASPSPSPCIDRRSAFPGHG